MLTEGISLTNWRKLSFCNLLHLLRLPQAFSGSVSRPIAKILVCVDAKNLCFRKITDLVNLAFIAELSLKIIWHICIALVRSLRASLPKNLIKATFVKAK